MAQRPAHGGRAALFMCLIVVAFLSAWPASVAAVGDVDVVGGDGAAPLGTPTAAATSGDDERCNYDSPAPLAQTADDLMADRYRLGQHPVVTLPHDLTWSEDPYHDRNWRQKFHQLRYVMALMYEWQDSGEDAYRDRALELVQSWLAANPRSAPASTAAWADQVTAWRAMTLVCIARMVPRHAWLDSAIAQHGSVLADPAFYVRHGNHALNQSIGLLDVGCYAGRSDWTGLARKRMATFVADAIDTQGVSEEQTTKYDRYDYDRFTVARAHLEACGLSAPAEFARVVLIPAYLAQASRPDGHYETVGDSDDKRYSGIPGTATMYTASDGKRGDAPSGTIAVYRRGYAFGRTGWGTPADPFHAQTFFSLRFAHGVQRHGHDDAGAVTLYGAGAQLLVDPGYGDLNSSRWHAYFASRAAHNVVTLADRSPVPSKGARLLRSTRTGRSVDFVIQVVDYPGISMQRRVVFSRELGYLIVEDTMSSSSAHIFKQLWHLTEDSRPHIAGLRTWTRRPSGNLLIQQLLPTGTTTRHIGETSPIQGWISRSYGQRAAAPVIQQRAQGRTVRFLTLLVPFGSGTGSKAPPITVTNLQVTAKGFRLDVSTPEGSERVAATATDVVISDAP